jgi:DNA-binding transcriptional LysR family regulator
MQRQEEAERESPGRLDAADLAVVLALVRGGNLAAAGALCGVDASTVFRSVQRAERALGQRVFERSRAGYRATDLGQRLAAHAERIEAELEAARSAVQAEGTAVAGRVRISTTDTVLHGLVLPALTELVATHPQLRLEVHAGNELVNLTQREADIAVRATRTPPPHLVGRALGAIRVALYARRDWVPSRGRGRGSDPGRGLDLAALPWLAVDEALPEHPSVRWRRKHLPAVVPRLVVNSVQSVLEGIAAGAGVGIVPHFLVRGRADLVALTGPLDDAETQLWLLTHPESRHLRRIATVAAHLAAHVRLD